MPRTSITVLLVALLGVTGSVVACGGADDDNATSNDSTETADGAEEEIKASVIGESQNGKTVEVQHGRSFTIALPENASTGFRWQLKSGAEGFAAPRDSMSPGDPSRPGSPGTRKLTFSTRRKALIGQHTIKLELMSPGAGTEPPAQIFEVTIAIVDGASAQVCGGFRGAQCTGENKYCEYAAGQACGYADQQGSCQTRPQFCPEIYAPVCGCDGKDYSNACFANAAGTSVAHDGSCNKGGSRCGDATCGPGLVCCNPLQGICTRPGQFCTQ